MLVAIASRTPWAPVAVVVRGRIVIWFELGLGEAMRVEMGVGMDVGVAVELAMRNLGPG
jgi:hypothetical protein